MVVSHDEVNRAEPRTDLVLDVTVVIYDLRFKAVLWAAGHVGGVARERAEGLAPLAGRERLV
jgi:hypothetical protein